MAITSGAGTPDISEETARDLYAQALAHARRSLALRGLAAVAAVPLGGLVAITSAEGAVIAAAIAFPILLAAAVSARAYVRLLKVTPAGHWRQEQEAEARLHRHSVEHELRLAAIHPWMSYGLAAALVVVFLAEMRFGSVVAVVQRAGYIKPAVLAGEWWRLATAACLHANAGHLLGNLGGLLVLGELIEAYDRRARVPIVFLAAAIGGSLASLALTNAAGLGASGGILGLAGYLMVRTFQGRLPGHVGRRILMLLAGTAFIGAVGYQFIGNAAHAGGAATGAVIAFLAPADDDRSVLDDALGRIALAVLVGVSLFTLVALTAGS